ncbi:MAG: protein kinase [Leptolyngbyaceae cyanobacterium SL_7_1]|nr:protein kinase [Leptolyngbyaceae cyanobacterium SL_7_1]
MSYCFNPDCSHPHNPKGHAFCQTCGAKLVLNGRYRAIKPLAKGGFGRTFLAKDEGKDSLCVVKQFCFRSINAATCLKAAAMFQQEAARLRELGPHAYIPDFFDHFQQDDRHYIVQEFVDGYNLAQELTRSGVFREDQIRQVLQELLPILHFVHQNQVIHRDIKPENIIRRHSDKRLMLIDFGAAKVSTEATLNEPGTQVGTAGFAAPEQLRGNALFISDLYSLGITCIYLLTGMSPLDLYDANQGNFAWRDGLGNNPVSHALAAILDRMICQVPSDRFASAQAVLEALSPVRTAIAAAAMPSRQPATVYAPPTLPPTVDYDTIQKKWTLKADRAVVWSIAFNPNGTTLAAGCGGGYWFGRVYGAEGAALRLWDVQSGEVLRTLPQSDRIHAVAFSPDGHYLAFAGDNQIVQRWNLRTNQVQVSQGHGGAIQFLAFSPDGRFLAIGKQGAAQVVVWDVTQGKVIQRISNRSLHSPIAFSPDSTTLAIGNVQFSQVNMPSYQLEVELWNLQPSPSPMHRFARSHEAELIPIELAFSPDGDTLACHRSLVELWNLPMRRAITALGDINLGRHARPIAFSPNGQLLVSGDRHLVEVWDILQAEHHHRFNLGAEVLTIAFNPGGTILAVGCADGKIHCWRFG